MQNYSRIFLFFLSIVLFFGFTKSNEDPKKDKLLIEIISYVIERGHYDPKEINDNFSENVYMNYLENLDGQHRFFLKKDLVFFKSYIHKAVQYYICEAIKEDRSKVITLLRSAGHNDLANSVEKL